MQQERATATAEINRLLSRPVDSPLPAPDQVTKTQFGFPVEAFEAEILSFAPQLRSAEIMLTREQRNLELAKKQFRPDFMTSVEYANSPNFPDMWEIKFGLRIPIFYKTKQAYGVKEASYNLTRAEKEVRSMRQEIAFTIRNQLLQIQASEKLLRLYEQAVLPQSNLALESSLATYQVGKSDFMTTMSNFMTLLEFRMNVYAELSRHETAIARLERVVGRPVAPRVPSAELAQASHPQHKDQKKERIMNKKTVLILLLLVGTAATIYLIFAKAGSNTPVATSEPAVDEKRTPKILYWVDPMHPTYKSDKPGIAPDCGMQLTPVYAEEETTQSASPGVVRLTGRKQQLINLKLVEVKDGHVMKNIRTVGTLQYDETNVTKIHSKIEGWIDKVYVDYPGKLVKKGQPLFSIYSPDLVATQQEYLLALKAERNLKSSEFADVSGGANALRESAYRRLKLWDVSDQQIRKLEEPANR